MDQGQIPMTQGYDPYHLASPTVYLIKILIFLIIVALVGAILATTIVTFFWANPFINSLIFFTLFIGIFLSFRQIYRLFPEVKWVNSLQDGTATTVRPPILLAPVAGLLRERIGEAIITPSSMRSILDSVGNRLDEAKDTSRYLTGLLVFLGLMGTFYGLLRNRDFGRRRHQRARRHRRRYRLAVRQPQERPDRAARRAWAPPSRPRCSALPARWCWAFSDLQTSQAQNAFYTDLEDWMTSMTELDHPVTAMQANGLGMQGADMQAMIDRLGNTMQNQNSSQNAIRAMAELARGIDGLVKHIRTEQDDLRTHIVEQGETNKKLRDLIEAMLAQDDTDRRN